MSGTKNGASKKWYKKYPGGVIQRFNSKINKLGPIIYENIGNCWVWKGTTTGKSHGEYGTFWDGKCIVTAHRYSLQEKLGRKLSIGMRALHMCDNSLCVNPSHLYEGTQGQNLIDAYSRNRRSGKMQSKMLLKARKMKLGY